MQLDRYNVVLVWQEIMDEKKTTEDYKKPGIVFEGNLEVKAGSPLDDFDDDLNWREL